MKINERMFTVLKERVSKHIEDDFGVQDCWNKMVFILSQDEKTTIRYLQECTEKELYWISEVFEDISEKFKSRKFIKCLRELDKKYPSINMTKDIDLAEDYINNFKDDNI